MIWVLNKVWTDKVASKECADLRLSLSMNLTVVWLVPEGCYLLRLFLPLTAAVWLKIFDGRRHQPGLSAATETSWIPSVCHSTGNLEFGATCKYCIYTGIYVRYCTVYTGTNDNHQHFELALPEALLVHLGQTKSKLNVRIHNCTYKLYEFLGSTKSAISFWPTDLYISASFGRTSLQLPPDSATTSKR